MKDQTDFTAIFTSLKDILLPYAKEMHVVHDSADNFYLDTRYIMQNKKPMYFGSVKINKKYVSFHLMPVYVFADLLKEISPELKRRMQGKSCFNFAREDQALYKELAALTKDGYLAYQKAGYLKEAE